MKRRDHLMLFVFIVWVWLVAPMSHAAWDFMFSNKAYATNLIVQTAVATSDQLQNLILNTEDSLDSFPQKSNGEIGTNNAYLFIRIKNTGDHAAWGTLSVVMNRHGSFDIDVPFVRYRSQWCHYIIYNSGIYSPKNEKPEVLVHWKRLCAK